MKPIYYFAYGSNLLESRLVDRLFGLLPKGRSIKHKTYRLYGYKLMFNCGCVRDTFANIVKAAPEDFVEGVLYEFTGAMMSILDRYEGCYEKEFFLNAENEMCFVYTGLSMYCSKKEDRPNLKYLNIILDGLFENKLYFTYNRLADYKLANYDITSSHHKKVNL